MIINIHNPLFWECGHSFIDYILLTDVLVIFEGLWENLGLCERPDWSILWACIILASSLDSILIQQWGIIVKF